MQPWIKAMALLEWLGNWVWGRLESMLEDNQEPSAPWPWASLLPRGRCPPCNPSAASDDLWPQPFLSSGSTLGTGGPGHYPAPTFTVISGHFPGRQHLFRLPPPCQPTAILLLGSLAVLFWLFFDVGLSKEHTK